MAAKLASPKPYTKEEIEYLRGILLQYSEPERFYKCEEGGDIDCQSFVLNSTYHGDIVYIAKLNLPDDYIENKANAICVLTL